MSRPRRLTTADTLPPVSVAPAEPLPSPVAAAEPEPAPELPQRSPERQHLADSIAALAALEAEIREADAAINPAQEATWAAQRALDDAERVLKDARPRDTYAPATSVQSVWVGPSIWGSQAEADEAARRARAAAEAPPISIADAKAAVEVAKDALDTARRTQQWHEARHTTARQSLTLRQLYVRDAVRNVLRSEPATLALAQMCRRLTTQAAAAREAFGLVITGDTIQPGSPFYGWNIVQDARDGTPEAIADWSVSRAWRAAIEALASDPDAPLPAA